MIDGQRASCRYRLPCLDAGHRCYNQPSIEKAGLLRPVSVVQAASGWTAMTFGPAPIDPERTYWPFILLIAAILTVMVGALLVFFT